MKPTIHKIYQLAFFFFTLTLAMSFSSANEKDIKYSFENGNKLVAIPQNDGTFVVSMYTAKQNSENVGASNKDQQYEDIGQGEFKKLTDNYDLEKSGSPEKLKYIVFSIDNGLFISFNNGKVVMLDQFILSPDGILDIKTIANNKETQYVVSFKFGESQATILINENADILRLDKAYIDVQTAEIADSKLNYTNKGVMKSYSIDPSKYFSADLLNPSEESYKDKSAATLSQPYSNSKELIPFPRDHVSSTIESIVSNAQAQEISTEVKKDTWYEVIDLETLNAKGVIHDVDPKAKEQVITHLLDIETSSAVIIGEAGAGKSTLINSIIYDLLKGDVPEPLKNHKIYKVSGASLTAGSKYRGDFEKRIEEMKTISSTEKAIWIIEDIHTVKTKGVHEGQPDGTFDMLSDKMKDGTIKIIGKTTTHDYFNVFDDPRMQRLLPPIVLEPLAEEKINPAIQSYLKSKYDIEVDVENVEFLKETVDRYDVVNSSISKYMDLLRKIMAKRVYDNKELALTNEDISNAAKQYYRVDEREFDKTQYKQLYLDLEQNLKKKLIGQSGLKKAILESTLQVLTDSYDQSKPRHFVLLDGPRGLGKTEIVNILEETLNLPLHRINMGQYKTAKGGDIEDIKLQIFQAMQKNPQSILFFDELDKAPIAIQDGLLDVFDGRKFHVRIGNSSSARSVSVDISRSSVFFGSNAGSEYIISKNTNGNPKRMGFIEDKVSENVEEILIDPIEHRAAIEESGKISTPFLSRIVKVVPAIPPPKYDFKEVLRLHMKKTIKEIEKSNDIYFILSKENEEKLLDTMTEKYFTENRDNRVFEHINDEIRTPFALSRIDNMQAEHFEIQLKNDAAYFQPTSALCSMLFMR